MEAFINSFYPLMPPKSPEGGLIGRIISIIKPTLCKSPFGGFRGQTRKAEKKIIFLGSPYFPPLSTSNF
jgi:hypothetical protein